MVLLLLSEGGCDDSYEGEEGKEGCVGEKEMHVVSMKLLSSVRKI